MLCKSPKSHPILVNPLIVGRKYAILDELGKKA
jgi:hypothetical protein